MTDKCPQTIYNLSQIIGDAFKSQGTNVFYSIDDIELTLAAYSVIEETYILSRDTNFSKYLPHPKKIFTEFYINSKNQIVYKSGHEFQPVPKDKMKKIM